MRKNNSYSLADMRAYLRDELPEGERKAMETAMLEDPLLAGAMEALEERLQEVALDEKTLDSLTSSFREAIPSASQDRQHTKIAYFSAPLVRRYAAIIVIFLAVGYLLSQLTGNNADPQTLFTENFSPYEDVINVRSEAQGDILLKSCMDAYNQKSYFDALNCFRVMVDKGEKESPFALLYGANSAMKMEKVDEAITWLLVLDGVNNALLDVISKWYLALAYLQKEEPHNAEVYLTDLVKTQSSYKKKAQKLLNQLH